MTKQTILIADDERNIVQLARLYLEQEGFQVESAANGQQALEKVSQLRPALVILDLMMPEVDGWEACRWARQGSQVPIIILTARGDDVDRIVGLEMGADDYVPKPFNPRELVARVKAVLRRAERPTQVSQALQVGDLRIEPERREAWVKEREIKLRPKEFELLMVMARHPGVVFDRERLLQAAWGYDFLGDSRTVDVHVTWVREKLAGSTARIQTVWGVGYKLVEALPPQPRSAARAG